MFMKPIRSLGIVVASLLLAATTSWGMLTTLSADADTYTRNERNAGTAADLDVRGFGGADFVAYIRFDLSGLGITSISSATLKLHETAGSRNDGITNGRHQLYGLTDAAGNTPQNWSEASDLVPGAEYTNVGGNGIDVSQVFNLDPEQGANVTEIVPGTDDVDVTTTGPDLVAFLDQRVAADGLATFIVTIDADNRGYGFASRENASEVLRPELTLDYIPEPTVTMLMLGGLGLLGLLRRR
jgi:hypothetical protein